ncbi:MAG: GntR family transcriptional regulator [Clostridia bacterium]|nr:GntR family transcriptional regulator [Clostridia bacterium]MBQ7048682.1 GntR family transcriptional regulator [Clostridia bacterium]
MIAVDKLSRTPIYEQLINEIERQITAEVLPVGAKLPSVRELSVKLCINPNTVQKALAELDSRKIIISAPGRGSFVAEDAKERILNRRLSKLKEFKELATLLLTSGADVKVLNDTIKEAAEHLKKEADIL